MLEERFQQYERLPRELHDEILIFTADLRASLAAFATDAVDAGQAEKFAARVENLEKRKGAALWGDYLRAHLAGHTNRVEEWERELMKVADRLFQGGDAAAALAVAEEVLESHPSAAAARLQVRALESLGDEARLEQALEQAWQLDQGSAQVALRLAARARARGDSCGELEWRGAALRGLVETSDWPALDECMLAVLEGDEPTSHEAAIDSLLPLMRAGQADRVTGYLDLGMLRWLHDPLDRRLVGALRLAVERAVAGENIRPALLQAMRSLHAGFSHLEEFLDHSGISRIGTDLGDSLKSWDELWTWRPGLVVEHNSMGLGIIRSNDGQRVQIDFPAKAGHSMTVNFAKQSLILLAPDSLKSQLARDREVTMARFDTDPGGVLADALQDLGGTAKSSDLKKHLAHLGFPTKSFAAWWKKAKAAAADHPRLDDHEAYRDVIHLVRDGGTAGRTLPRLDTKKGPKTAVTMLTRFLAQHPGALEEAKKRYRPYFQSWASDPGLGDLERAAAVLTLARWFPEDADDWSAIAGGLDPVELDAPNWSSVRDQEYWFDLLTRHSRWASLLPPFLGSKKAELRALCQRALQERWGECAGAELERLLERASELPAAAVALCAEALNKTESPSWFKPWRAVLALVSVLEGRAPEPVVKEALGMLDANEGALLRLLKNAPPPEDLAITLEQLVRHWRSSDRFLFPVMEFLRATPAAAISNAAEESRAAAFRKLEIPSAGSTDADATLMTRRTFDRHVTELERLDRELKTTIPLAIRKARELGDLRENAEYDAAKLKQRQTTQRCEQLQSLIHRARLIEEISVREDSAGPGTEVVLHGDGAERTVWILGEGDSDHGPEVVGYLAPAGRALQGHKVGDRVTLTGDGGADVEYEVRQIRRRVPPAPVQDDSPLL
ncbi:MAG: GreA/GreB family elongation factor [Candidatus Eisenbacteria bacterium]|nr:GreA/GreB family elongation factor [Candidatus Eisenbacteria bacterium]